MKTYQSIVSPHVIASAAVGARLIDVDPRKMTGVPAADLLTATLRLHSPEA